MSSDIQQWYHERKHVCIFRSLFKADNTNKCIHIGSYQGIPLPYKSSSNAALVLFEVTVLHPCTKDTFELCELAKPVLEKNCFALDEKSYHQNYGTANDMKLVPRYSNIFIVNLEKKEFGRTLHKSSSWLL